MDPGKWGVGCLMHEKKFHLAWFGRSHTVNSSNYMYSTGAAKASGGGGAIFRLKRGSEAEVEQPVGYHRSTPALLTNITGFII